MRLSRVFHVSISLLITCLLVSAGVHADTDFDTLIVFGDSLSDPGNKFAVTGLSNEPPYDLLDVFVVPNGPYARGGHHHSNGATWVEQYARSLGLGDQVRPAYQSGSDATNYAYGGARARNVLLPSDPVIQSNKHLPDQVSQFLADIGNEAPADALYVIFVGSNDIAPDAVTALAGPDPGVSIQIIGAALTSVSDNIIALYLAGARHFLVLNAPDLGLTPAVQILDQQFPGAKDAASCLSFLYNFGTPVPCVPTGIDIPGLAGVLDQLEANPFLDGITFTRIDIFTQMHALVEFPDPFGLTNVTSHCVQPDVPPYACKRPDEYLFWDGAHPTKTVHAIFAGLVAAELEH
jgi:phospholipase/lecithinase/hemolysin